MQLLMILSQFNFTLQFSSRLQFLTLFAAIGLVHGWRSFLWTAALPPILIVIVFKIWLTKKYMNAFRYYVPDEREIASSKVHSEHADARGNSLQRRFGHPALHADLYTPMVHANMVELLPQVYNGRLSQNQAGLTEYGGQKVGAVSTPGGLKIAGIEQVISQKPHEHLLCLVLMTLFLFRINSNTTRHCTSVIVAKPIGIQGVSRQRTCFTLIQ